MRVKSVALLAVIAVAAATAPAGAAPAEARRRIDCTDGSDAADRLVLRVGGEKATGHYALPADSPETLVVFGHGYGHTSFSWVNHLRWAADNGMAAAAMDYRGLTFLPDENNDGLPNSRGWPAKTGAEDLLAAARLFDRSCASIDRVVIFGVSMGANMAGLAVAMAGEDNITKFDHAAGKHGSEPLFDYFFDIEGAANVTETYLEASAVAPSGNKTAVQAKEDIEAEMGGPFHTHQNAYLERTLVNRGDDIADAGLDGVVLVHAVNDGLVPYNQSREMVGVLRAHGIPSDFYTVTTRDSDSEGDDTTITGYAKSDDETIIPLAGHASEKSNKHIVMNVAFEQLLEVLETDEIVGLEYLVHGTNSDRPQYIGKV